MALVLVQALTEMLVACGRVLSIIQCFALFLAL